MSARRAGAIIAVTLVVLGGTAIGLYVALFLEVSPPPVNAAVVGPRQAALELQTVAEVGHGETQNWVSYYSRTPGRKWVHSTILRVPAYSLIHVTVYQYDTATGLRNPLWGQPRGLVGNVMYVNGKPLKVLNPALASHTFAVPELGVTCRCRASPKKRPTSAPTRRAVWPRRTTRSPSPSARRVPASTGGSASCPARRLHLRLRRAHAVDRLHGRRAGGGQRMSVPAELRRLYLGFG